MKRPILVALLAAGSGPLFAQTLDELSTVRNRPAPYSELLQLRAGVLGARASSERPAAGLEDAIGWDGSAYYRSETFLGRPGTFEAYAGRDGAFLGIHDHALVGNETSSVLELHARYFPFYREGFYRGDEFVPTGMYEGRDYEGYLGFGRPMAEDLRLEFGPFYRHNSFDRSSDTSPTFIVPDDYAAYGLRVFLEQQNLQLDRVRGIPNAGYVLTVVGEREWNDSDRSFGQAGVFETRLPSAVWRARARLEWYLPQSDDSVWEIFATGALTDEKDRVWNYDAQRPQGNAWVDAQLRYRLAFGDSFTIAPFIGGQFVRILDGNGTSSDKEFFFGGGAELWLHFTESVSMNAWYSYLDNESRPSVSVSDDEHGEHMFYVGMVARFGGQRR